jgi:phosphatidylserine/phosphatidylglycerophosphate/cardiolipin synthase-like enzyme
MLNILRRPTTQEFTSHLYDEKSFYTSFIKDLSKSKSEVIIESPFVTMRRVEMLLREFQRLLNRGVSSYVVTRDPSTLEETLSTQSRDVIRLFENIGVQVLATTNNHHRKLAIIDREVLWEGSLNILSQLNSREIMRRIDSKDHALEMFEFLKLGRFIKFSP